MQREEAKGPIVPTDRFATGAHGPVVVSFSIVFIIDEAADALLSSSSASYMVTLNDGVKFQHEIVGSHIVPSRTQKGVRTGLGFALERAGGWSCAWRPLRQSIIMMDKFHQFVFSTAQQKAISAEFGTGGIQQWSRNDPNVALDRKYAGRPIRVFHLA